MAEHDVFHAHFLQHIGGDFTSERAGFLEMAVLRAHLDICACCGLEGNLQIDKRDADHNAAAGVCNEGLELLDQSFCLGRRFIHFPVSRNDSGTKRFIHIC